MNSEKNNAIFMIILIKMQLFSIFNGLDTPVFIGVAGPRPCVPTVSKETIC